MYQKCEASSTWWSTGLSLTCYKFHCREFEQIVRILLSSWFSEKAMAPHSSTLAWKIPWMEKPGGLQSMGSLRVGHDWGTSLSLSCIGEGNGNPLQYSCLENPMDGGAWWAAVRGVAQSRTRLSDLAAAAAAGIALQSHLSYFQKCF